LLLFLGGQSTTFIFALWINSFTYPLLIHHFRGYQQAVDCTFQKQWKSIKSAYIIDILLCG